MILNHAMNFIVVQMLPSSIDSMDTHRVKTINVRAEKEMQREDTPLRHRVLHRSVVHATAAAAGSPGRGHCGKRRGVLSSASSCLKMGTRRVTASVARITTSTFMSVLVLALAVAATVLVAFAPPVAGLPLQEEWVQTKVQRLLSWHSANDQQHLGLLPPSAVYDRTTNTVLCVSPKGGSSTFFQWLFLVSTNGTKYYECKDRTITEHPQSLGPCWLPKDASVDLTEPEPPRQHRLNVTSGLVSAGGRMSIEEQETVSSDPDVFWFAITRDPIERAISAWKSKLACPGLYVLCSTTPAVETS